MKVKGRMFVGLSCDYPQGKIRRRTYMDEECRVFRTASGKRDMVEPYCSYFGVNMAGGRVADEYIVRAVSRMV